MWWIPVLIGGSAVYIFKKVFQNKDNKNLNNRTTLEKNFERISQNLNGQKVIAIVGQPGAGKSTLLSKLTNNQCTPQPIIGQKTDSTHWHDRSDVNLFHSYKNIYYVDSPGYDTKNHPVDSYIKYFPFEKFDKIIFVVKQKIHGADESLFNHLKNILRNTITNKLIVVRGFSEDCYAEHQDAKHIEEIRNDYNVRFELNVIGLELIFLSNRYDKGLNEIKNFIGI